MNLHIIKGLFDDCPSLINQFFVSESFSLKDSIELKRLYDTIEYPQSIAAKLPIRGVTALSFGCTLSHKQLAAISELANTYDLFSASEVSEQDMANLFDCKLGFNIRVNNLRRIAILFDALLNSGMVQWDWQSILERGKFLMKKSGDGHVTASSLSSALSASRRAPTSANEAIRKAVYKLSR